MLKRELMRSYDDGGAIDNEKRHRDRSLKREVTRIRRRKDRMKWNYLTLHIQCCLRRLRVMVAHTKKSTTITGDRPLIKLIVCVIYTLYTLSDWRAPKAVNYG